MAEVIERRADGRRRRKADEPHGAHRSHVRGILPQRLHNDHARPDRRRRRDRGHDLRLLGTGSTLFTRSIMRGLMKIDARHRTGHLRFQAEELHRGSGTEHLSFVWHHFRPRRREVNRMLIAEAWRFPRSPTAIARNFTTLVDLLSQRFQHGVEHGGVRRSAVTEVPLVIIAPVAGRHVVIVIFDEATTAARFRGHSSTLASISC